MMIVIICLILFQCNFCFSEIPKWALQKKEVTILDWKLLKAEFDIREALQFEMDTFFNNKTDWKIMPMLSLIGGTSEEIFVSYNLISENYFSLELLQRKTELEKIIEFTISKVNRYFYESQLNRKDFRILFIVDGIEIAELENGKLTVKEK